MCGEIYSRWNTFLTSLPQSVVCLSALPPTFLLLLGLLPLPEVLVNKNMFAEPDSLKLDATLLNSQFCITWGYNQGGDPYWKIISFGDRKLNRSIIIKLALCFYFIGNTKLYWSSFKPDADSCSPLQILAEVLIEKGVNLRIPSLYSGKFQYVELQSAVSSLGCWNPPSGMSWVEDGGPIWWVSPSGQRI